MHNKASYSYVEAESDEDDEEKKEEEDDAL